MSHVILEDMQIQTDLGHNNILAPKAVIRVRVVEIHPRDGNGGVRADVFHSCHFRFGFAPRQKPAGNARNDGTAVA